MSTYRDKIIILSVATVLLLFILPFLQLKAIFILLLVILYYLTIIIFLMPELGIFLLILIRPSLDIFTNESIISLNNFNLNFSSLLAIITLVLAFYVFIKKINQVKKIPLVKSISVFLSIALLSIFFSIDKLASLTEWVRLLSIFSLYFLGFLFINSLNDLKKLLKVIILSAIIPALLAAYQYFTASGMSLPFEGIYNRIYGTFAHPNLFAYYLIIPIALLLYLFLTGDKKKVENIFLILPLLIFILLLTLTFTRGAWLALIIFIFIIGLVKYRKLLIMAFLIIILSYFAIIPIKNRVNNLIANPYSSITWRLGLWSDSLNFIKEKPILGQGTGTAKDYILDKRGAQFGSSDPHNDYLKIALENGALGLLAYLFLIASLLYNLIKTYFSASQLELKIFVLFLFALSITFYIMSFADNILRNTALEWVFWSLIGAGFALTSPKSPRPV